ncbi:MAG: ferrochelatase [Robiginitomaculum sp.]|nr:MAG: ferrochelatase [Robiginitomaculum sp.]
MKDKVGILLVNLGSPTQPTPKATRKYLAQFLSDKRVIELSKLLWYPILYGIILRTRPKKSAQAYASVWRKDDNGDFVPYSALIETSLAQAEALQDKMPEHVYVRAGMRYGHPSIETELLHLKGQGCKKIIVLPLYPQFAGATTQSVYDEVARVCKKHTSIPALEVLGHYYDHPDYITAIGNGVKAHLETLDWKADKILVSFHGLPRSSIDKGDPYERECEGTYELIRKGLPTLTNALKLTYQSRFGPKEWLSPYTTIVLKELAESGQENVVIVTPGFAADCLETLEELSIGAKSDFIANGGKNLSVVPCLNANEDHIELFAKLVQKYI